MSSVVRVMLVKSWGESSVDVLVAISPKRNTSRVPSKPTATSYPISVYTPNISPICSPQSKREKMSSVVRVMLVKSWGESSVDVLVAILASRRDSTRSRRVQPMRLQLPALLSDRREMLRERVLRRCRRDVLHRRWSGSCW
jgi:hypothetical protein